jgi:hypothetical protein
MDEHDLWPVGYQRLQAGMDRCLARRPAMHGGQHRNPLSDPRKQPLVLRMNYRLNGFDPRRFGK